MEIMLYLLQGNITADNYDEVLEEVVELVNDTQQRDQTRENFIVITDFYTVTAALIQDQLVIVETPFEVS